MDGGLFNRQRPTDRRTPVPNRGDVTTAHATVQESSTIDEHHRSTAASHHHTRKQKLGNKLMSVIIVGASVLVLCTVTWFIARTYGNNGVAEIDNNKYQAVFLSNGQVYFGKLQVLGSDYLKLTKVFYIQGSTDTDANAAKSKDPQQTTSSDMKLIKLGKEVHGPEDAMIINRDQVQFYENLKSDGEVAKLISQYKE